MSDRIDRLIIEAFAGHEQDVPTATGLRAAIAEGARRRRIRRRWTFSGAAAIVLALVTALPLVLLGGPAGTLHAESLLGDQTVAAGVRNFLLLGIDRRPEMVGETVRADAILLVHLDPATRTAYQVSIPRDLLVDVPGFGTQRANTAFVFGGYDLTARVVADVLGVPVDGGVVIDFTGMQRITEAVGGVDLCVDQRTVSATSARTRRPAARCPWPGQQRPSRSCTSPAAGTSPAGRPWTTWRQDQSLPGGSADRDTHLRQFLAALVRELTDPLKLAKAVPVAGQAFDLHLDGVPLPALIGMLGGFDGGQLPGLRLPVTDDLLARPGGDGLFTALRTGTVPAWAAAHPQYAG